MHPWQKTRIDAEKILTKNYGLKRKKEIWKMGSLLKRFTTQAKNLMNDDSNQGAKEKEQLLTKLYKLGLVEKDATLANVLALTIDDVMEKRLQTIVYKKSLAMSVKHARQLIFHGHILVSGKKVTSPSYIVLQEEVGNVTYSSKSSLNQEDHPSKPSVESPVKKKEVKEEVKEEKPKKKAKPKAEAKPKKEKKEKIKTEAPKEELKAEEKSKEELKVEEKKEEPKEDVPKEEVKPKEEPKVEEKKEEEKKE